jgi:hypothetical protein
MNLSDIFVDIEEKADAVRIATGLTDFLLASPRRELGGLTVDPLTSQSRESYYLL